MTEKILIADNHSMIRSGLSIMINRIKPDAEIEEVDSFKSLCEIINRFTFGLIILETNMPDGTAQQAIDLLQMRQPLAKLLVFSSQSEDVYALRYLQYGASGFLCKTSNNAVVEDALRKMFSTGKYLSQKVQEAIIFQTINSPTRYNQNPLHLLSSREIEIANKLIEGISLKEIANSLYLHISTTSTYKARIFKKLEIQSVPDLIEVFRFYDILKSDSRWFPLKNKEMIERLKLICEFRVEGL